MERVLIIGSQAFKNDLTSELTHALEIISEHSQDGDSHSPTLEALLSKLYEEK